MVQTIRTFVAVEMDVAIRKAAAGLIEKFRAAGAGVGWVAPENMHLTLKFLGDVGVEDIPNVCEAVREAAAGAAPFTLQVSGAGAFPNLSRPRVIWLGASEGEEAMEYGRPRVFPPCVNHRVAYCPGLKKKSRSRANLKMANPSDTSILDSSCAGIFESCVTMQKG